MIQTRDILSAIAAVVLTFSFAGSAQARSFEWARIDWSAGDIRILGEGVPADGRLPQDVAARLWLLLRDTPVSSDHRLSDHFASFDEFRGFLLHSDITFKQEADELGNLTYIFPIGERGGLVDIISAPSLPSPLINRQEKNIQAPIAYPSAEFSSIIFDLSGVRFSPVMAPRIVDESGQPMFEISRADVRDLRKRGMVGFARTIDEALSDPRSGASPLVVRAISANNPRRGDICLSSRDLALMKQSKPFGDLLKSCRIVIVTN